MNFIKWTLISLTSILLSAASLTVIASEKDKTVTQEAKSTGHAIAKGTKKTWHKVEEKGCEWVKGKLECAKQRVEHKATEIKDDLKN